MNAFTAAEQALIEGLVRDVERTTALRLAIRPDGGFAGVWWEGQEDPALSTTPVNLPDAVQANVIERLGRPWPLCPEHRRHPLRFVVQSGGDGTFERGGWVCPRLPIVGCALGEVPDVADIGEEPLPDGTVRWWNADGGYGALADRDGDVWFHFTSERERRTPGGFDEGEVLDYAVAPGQHRGAFRRAAWVRRTSA